ncbi:oxidoreductase, short chain dehydrogenase/reductase family protein [Aeromicrobium marinum DSM 15272]|uniref:Oxidoreductase, short chain dehydrogenase/reductase family protein n=1 Tax=Aeromicrobium marinum DSM 15272 TaxID=585531 RepID=E2SE96_9ACTN|nr:SDR family NAD(P)-dependent oxidoreductase [Aeromicrobium marinum]EFQ82823.1 oxidoreductase, short chain dehydrogenase/reductase family protein [Aeromicrobium marinum DSM 15272]
MAGRALITGATAGIGNAFARALAERGHDLVVVARDTARLEQLAADLRATNGVEVEVLTADLTDPDGLARVVNAVTDSTRPVDLLVNNAGASLAGWFGSTDIADEDRQLDLLVRAPMHLMDAAIKAMSGRGHGQVVNVASVAAFTPRGAYSAHKAWLVNLSQWAHLHYADAGISVMALCPGFVRTEFHQRMGADISTVPRWMWLNADKVVATALEDLERGRPISVPSLRYKLLTALSRHLPAGLVAKIAKRGR